MEIALVLVALVALAAIGYAFALRRRGPEPATLDTAEVDRLVAQLRGEVAALQAGALQQNTQQFLALAEERLKAETARGEEQLKARQGEIERSLQGITESLKQVTSVVESIDKQRGQSIVQLATVTTESRKAMESLVQTTNRLDQALAGGQMRGQWGERMAEDILRVAGFLEGVNYRRNQQLEAGTRPDFTFYLPQDRVLHMDVKFPLAGYLRLLEAGTDDERQRATRGFMSDVRARIKEVTTREYIDPANGTLDYMLVFIPNEQVYGFIHEHDPAVLDDALRQRVVLCSPITLFAVLAVIRQSVDNFRLSEQTDRILSALGSFAKQWQRYQRAVETLGKRLDATQRAYDALATTRTNQLQRQIDRVEAMRLEAGVPREGGEDDELEAPDPQLEIPAQFLR